ncbi:SAM-dependent methyltransferase [uncultured Legionella sp.]|uniref:SAM-dependent methyltransferase n=1 Tax=uncultured Legionella sp. TaxID=210934 RepID=UPI00261CDA05|nr:SAM-dependent methyltransferase [uncultured Legionella sp.]
MPQLIIIGSGIKSLAHLTQEVLVIIKQSEKVLYLLNEPYLKEWIERESKISESLEPIYFAQEKRIDNYKAITNYIVEEYKKHSSLCFISYGHPTIYDMPAITAAREINEQGGNAIILPAISSMDCLFADLVIDPSDSGCYSADATDFLIYSRPFDPRSHLILLQVGAIATYNQETTHHVHVLRDYLLKYYEKEHRVCYYEAALYPQQKPRMDFFPLSMMAEQPVNGLTTLYIPPINKATQCNMEMLKLLNMEIDNFLETPKVNS